MIQSLFYCHHHHHRKNFNYKVTEFFLIIDSLMIFFITRTHLGRNRTIIIKNGKKILLNSLLACSIRTNFFLYRIRNSFEFFVFVCLFVPYFLLIFPIYLVGILYYLSNMSVLFLFFFLLTSDIEQQKLMKFVFF